MGSDAAEFVNKVKDQMRSRQKRTSNVAESGEEHSIIWGMFMVATLNAATFMGKNFSTIQNFIMNSEDLTLKQMFDITAKLVSDQDEINCLDIIGQRIHGENCHWLVMKQLSIFSAQKSMSSRIVCCASERSFNIQIPTKLGRTELQGSWPRKATEIMTVSMESRPNSSGTSSQDSQRLQLCGKVSDLLSDMGQTPETFTGRILFMSMTSPVTEKATKKNVWQMPESSKYLQRNLVLDNGHLLVQVLKRSGILQRIVHNELGIISRTKCCRNLQKAGSLFSVQRLHCRGEISKARDMENCQYTSLQTIQQLKQFFA